MKIFTRNIFILIIPFIIMIITNEFYRFNIKERPYSIYGVKTLNSVKHIPNKCSWVCHNNTEYCKAKHVKYLKPYYGITDVLYFCTIKALRKTGNYSAANIIFLVLIFPFSILYFIIKSLNIQDKIRKLSK